MMHALMQQSIANGGGKVGNAQPAADSENESRINAAKDLSIQMLLYSSLRDVPLPVHYESYTRISCSFSHSF
jgi:hypothetical protein